MLLPREIEAGETVRVAGLEMRVFQQSHGRSDTLGFRIGRFGYSTDVVHLDEFAHQVLQGTDTWLVDCFQRTTHPAHAWLDLVVDWSRRLGVRRTILTHMGVDLDWRWMTENLPTGFEPAHDGMVIEA